MASDYDPTEFVDGDFEAHRTPVPAGVAAAGAAGLAGRAPSREEVDSRVSEAQQKLAELKRAQEELERERAALEETRRRQLEFQNGRQEMVQHLTRGVGLLEEAEFGARRDAEQMAKTLVELKDALTKVQGIREESWTADSFPVELTRALTTLENARMEWNSARLKFPVLTVPTTAVSQAESTEGVRLGPGLFANYTFADLCRIGFALTWPLVGVALLALVALVVFLYKR